MPVRRRFGVRATAPDAMRRNLALLRAFRDVERRRVTIGAIVGVAVEATLVSAAVGARPGPLAVTVVVIGSAVVFAIVTFAVAGLLRPRRVTRALDLYRWVQRRDLDRWRTATGEQRPAMPSAARTWLESHPAAGGSADLPRIELLILIGEFDVARRVVATLPTDTPVERFERALRAATVDFIATGDGELGPAREALEALGETDRPEPIARLAVEESRQLAATAATTAAAATAATAATAAGAADMGRRAGRSGPSDGIDRRAFLDPLVRAREVPGLPMDGHLVPDLARWVARPLLLLGSVSAIASFVVAVTVVHR
ncbi:MAG TPA: hypothetical protein VEG29_08385 [Candidatus Binatia bacterium]|nr:hypothetical protein [Candidatus Binatia bacterium]